MSYSTAGGSAVEGTPYREAQVCLGPKWINSYYLFFATGTSTPANVYQDGALTSPFPITGQVTADNYGRFPPIYLDTSVTYRVQFFNNANVQQWQVDPYVPPLATVGTSSKIAYGMNIATTGEVTIPAPNTGGSGVSLTLKAGSGGTPLKVVGTLAGNSALIVNSSATTGAQTATFAATNKPGTATSSPAGWLPITCDAVQYYTPIWHGNPFSQYAANNSPAGESINASSVLFGGNGATTATGGTATPGNWYAPATPSIGASYYINITKTSGLSGLAFSAAQGAWTNIGAGGLTISSNAQAPITGTYQLSTSSSGSPVVANGTITLQNNNGVQMPTYNGAENLVLGGDGTASLNGVSTSNWFLPTTANTGAGYWIKITQTGGTSGTTFNAAAGTYANITNGGLTIGITGGTGLINASGTYTIASDSGGVNVLGNGNITLTGNSSVQSSNWSGTTPLKLNGNGSATLNGASTSSWYSPNASNVGSGYYINISRTSGTTGVNFTAAQGAFTNITNSGLTIDMSGYSGDVGTVTLNGTYQISNSNTGTPVLGSGSISLSVNAGTVTHVYTSGTSATETVPTGASTVVIEIFGASGGGGGGKAGCSGAGGGGGGSGGYSRSSYACSGGQTLTYTVPSSGGSGGGVGLNGSNGTASTVSSGTLAITTMTAPGGGGGSAGGSGGGGGAAGATGTGGNAANAAGNAGATHSACAGGAGGAGVAGVNGYSGLAGGAGGVQGSTGIAGGSGRVVFRYS